MTIASEEAGIEFVPGVERQLLVDLDLVLGDDRLIMWLICLRVGEELRPEWPPQAVDDHAHGIGSAGGPDDLLGRSLNGQDFEELATEPDAAGKPVAGFGLSR